MLNERFWCKVILAGEDACWIWTANKNNQGYGLFRPGGRTPKKLAHRLSYEAHYGVTLPPGQAAVVMHSCDNPACVNPKHLKLGTMKANYEDMVKKLRRRVVSTYANLGEPKRGTAQHCAKLTEDQVRQIRQDIANGEPTRAVARRLGMHPSTIRRIRDRKGWAHV